MLAGVPFPAEVGTRIPPFPRWGSGQVPYWSRCRISSFWQARLMSCSPAGTSAGSTLAGGTAVRSPASAGSGWGPVPCWSRRRVPYLRQVELWCGSRLELAWGPLRLLVRARIPSTAAVGAGPLIPPGGAKVTLAARESARSFPSVCSAEVRSPAGVGARSPFSAWAGWGLVPCGGDTVFLPNARRGRDPVPC